jgi:hypothetical protein
MYFVPFRPAYDSAGISVPGSQHYFTVSDGGSGGDTPSAPYLDAAMTIPASNPVIADGAGKIPAIYLDEAVTYRVRIYGRNAVVGVDTPLEEYAPYLPGTAGIEADIGLRADLAEPTGGSLVAYAATLAGASTLSVADKLNETVSVHDFGAVGDGVTDDSAAILAAIAAVSAAGGGTVELPKKSYNAGSTPIILESDVHLRGKRTTISSNATFVIGDAPSTTGHSIEGVKFVQTANSNSNYCFDFSGQYVEMKTVEFATSPATHAVTGYFRKTFAYWMIDGFKASGANGIFISGHDGQVANWDLDNGGGQDDGWVFKGAGTVGNPAQCYNIEIGKGIIRGYGAAFAFGSEVGLNGADDPLRQNFIRTINIHDVIAERCQFLTYFKNGGIYDYRDGDVEDVTFENIELRDMGGVGARCLANIITSRGGRLRNIHFNNVHGRYRAPNRSGGLNVGIAITLLDFTGGTLQSEISGIYIDGMSVIDPFGGIANGELTTEGYNGVASGSVVPGYPIDSFIYVDTNFGSGGSKTLLKAMEIKNFVGNGCARAAFGISSNAAGFISGPIRLHSPILENYAAGSLVSTDDCAIDNSGGTVQIVGGMRAIPAATAPVGTRGVMGDDQTDKTQPIVGERVQITLGDLAAGATASRQFTASADLWISKVWISNRAAIAADAVNKITVYLANKDTGAQLTQKDSDVDFAVAAFTPVSINGATQFTGANAYLGKGKVMDIQVASSGSATLDGATMTIEFVLFGAA